MIRRTTHSDILEHLRSRIVRSAWRPGQRLPTRAQLQMQFGASMTTVQRALVRLEKEGFVNPRGTQGTFVSDTPPHLHRYALVFPRRGGTIGDLFYTALERAAAPLAAERRLTLELYRDVHSDADSEELHRLTYDVKAHRLAGLIFASHPSLEEHSPLVETLGIPRVAVMWSQTYADIPALYPDLDDFTRKAVAELARQGRRRVAVIAYAGVTEHHVAFAQRQIQQAGMVTQPFWFLGLEMTANSPRWLRQATQLMLAGDPQHRPDGLIIMDDNLVPHVIDGVRLLDRRVPEELGIVAHANFPDLSVLPLPVTRIGFDAGELIEQCLNLLQLQRQGQTPPRLTLLPARSACAAATAPEDPS